MSNMYTILDSLKKVTPKQEPLENKKPQAIYESVEAKGSILEGVAKVEEKLKEQFAKFNEGDTEYKNGVTKHKGTYGTEYQGDADDEDAPKRGRPAKGTAKKEKVVRVKGPKGRPKKDPGASAPAKIGNDPFGRVPDKAPKGAKGTVIKGKATQDTNEDQINELSPKLLQKARDAAGEKWSAADDRRDQKASDKSNRQDDKFNSALRKKQKDMTEAENPFASFKKQAKGAGLLRSKTKTKTMESSRRMAKLLIEGVNFTEMVKKKDMTLQEMLAELQADIQSFKETGHCSELLRDCMEVHSYGKSQLNDATENPMDNDNFPMPLAPARPSMMDRAKRMGGQVLNTLGHGSDEDMKADLRHKMGMQEAAELNELARLAGLTVKEANDGNLANNAKPYKTVTRRDVIQGAQGKDEQGGEAEVDEAAKYRDPKYKDRLYTQELPDYENDDYSDDEYYNGPRPDDYAGSKNLIGGDEFDHNDPLRRGFGRSGHDVLDRGPRKGMPSRNHITSLKGSIKAAHGTHSGPNLPEGDESQSQPAVRIINDFDEVVDQFDHVPKGFRDALRSSEFDAVQWLADIMKKDPNFDITTIEKIVLRPGVYGPDEHVIDVTEYLDHLDEGSESNIRDTLAYEIRMILDGALADDDQTDHIVDELGDIFNDIEASGDREAMMAYEMMVDAIDTDAETQVDAARQALKLLNLDEGDMEEGAGVMHFKALQAKADGKDSFKLGDEEFPVQEGETCPTCKSEPCACEDTEAADRELAKLKENCGIVSPIGSMAQDMQQQQGKMSINTTQSSDGTKNINISADGEAADQLMQMLKMAGMAGGQQQHAEVVVTAEPMEAKQYGNTDIDKPEEVLNTPRPDVRGMHRAETVGYADTTDDLNKQKDQDPETANRAANPKTPKANKVEESHPLEALGAKLMAEYQSIKLTK